MIIVEIAGFLGADPEERFTAGGKRVVTMRVATRVRQDGQENETVWWEVNIWNDRYDKMLPYLKKGSAVLVIGKMTKKPRIYDSRDGSKQVALSINADILEFSPFGRPDRPGEPQAAQTAVEDPFAAKASPSNQYAGIGAMAAEQEGSFAGDDLPF